MESLSLKAYEILKSRLGAEEAGTLIGYFDERFEKEMKKDKDVFLTKDDKTGLMKWVVGLLIVQMAAIGGLYLRMSDLSFRLSEVMLKLSELGNV